MQRSIQHDTNSAAIYATAEDYVNRHSSVANFYADAYREILLQVWDVDDETREEIEEHLEQPPSSCLLYTSPSPRDKRQSRMPSSA